MSGGGGLETRLSCLNVFNQKSHQATCPTRTANDENVFLKDYADCADFSAVF